MYHQRDKFLREQICYRIAVIDVCARMCALYELHIKRTTMKRIKCAISVNIINIFRQQTHSVFVEREKNN